MRQTFLLLAAALLSARPLPAQMIDTIPPGRGPVGPSAPTSAAPPGVVGTVPLAVSQSHDPLNAPAKEKLADFDPIQTEIRWLNNHWQLLAGGVFIKDLGTNEGNAREALRVIHDLHLSQRGTVGEPQPVMEYWLAGGHAPQGVAGGLRLLPMDLNSLRVESFQGQWFLRDANRVYFVFGTHGEEAAQALDVIHRHGFSQVGYVGQPSPSLVYFLGGPNSLAHSDMVPVPQSSPGITAANSGQLPATMGTQPGQGMGSFPARQLGGTMPRNSFPEHLLRDINPQVLDQSGQTDRVVFDSRQVQVRRDNQDWKLYFGPHAIANFGPNQSDARQALNVLQLYHCNEQCLIGQPREPSFTYFLSNGQPPRGTVYGMASYPFRPDNLSIRQIGADWSLCDSDRVLARFGAKVEDAKQLLQVIQQQQFDHICHVGHGDVPGMNILVRTH
jgi:hypothetical protein